LWLWAAALLWKEIKSGGYLVIKKNNYSRREFFLRSIGGVASVGLFGLSGDTVPLFDGEKGGGFARYPKNMPIELVGLGHCG